MPRKKQNKMKKSPGASGAEIPWFLKSTRPVLFPSHATIGKPDKEFHAYIEKTLGDYKEERESLVDRIRTEIKKLKVEDFYDDDDKKDDEEDDEFDEDDDYDPDHESSNDNNESKPQINNQDNIILTENGDQAFKSTNNALVDFLAEAEPLISGDRLETLLFAAWADDPLSTLKLIFNCRSIHLGKGSKEVFYRCAGWLANNHPLTLVSNLRWLTRPVIEKKVGKNKDGDDEFEIIESEGKGKDETNNNDKIAVFDNPTLFDVENGVAHGCWKDLLNILVLAVNHKLDPDLEPNEFFRNKNPGIIRGKRLPDSKRQATQDQAETLVNELMNRNQTILEMNETEKYLEMLDKLYPTNDKEFRRETRHLRHKIATNNFARYPVYEALHLTVARLFAQQLQSDLAALNGNDSHAKKNISLCGKWAPSHDRLHDKHTFIVSSIAEMMYPYESTITSSSITTSPSPQGMTRRELYLRHAREMYRRDISALRKHLDVVERHITTNNFKDIRYDTLPSVALKTYTSLFAEKDSLRFEGYVDNVMTGKAKTSGAILQPAQIIKMVQQPLSLFTTIPQVKTKAAALHNIKCKLANGQWNTLVQRIKDSGSLSSSIAVCDVSASMNWCTLSDGTKPIDHSLALSLLVAEVTAAPFGGSFITFSETPQLEQIPMHTNLAEKVSAMKNSLSGSSTNFVSVFKDLILPMAVKAGLKQEDMVKRVFVFSDMHFDQAEDIYDASTSSTTTSSPDDGSSSKTSFGGSFAEIKKLYAEARYEMPELVFWNLAGGGRHNDGDAAAPKPVLASQEGVCMVSGYSQGMLKVFLDGGGFRDVDGDENLLLEDKVVAGDDGEDDAVLVRKRAAMDSVKVMRRAISHKAYDMLKVYD